MTLRTEFDSTVAQDHRDDHRALHTRYNAEPEVQVEEYGATAAGLQAALDTGAPTVRLSTSFTTDQRRIVIPPTCKRLLADGVKITLTYEQDTVRQIDQCFLLADGCDDLTIRGLELEYTGTFDVDPPPYSGKVCGLITNNCKRLTLDRLNVHGFNDYGVMVTPSIDWGSIEPAECEQVHVTRSSFHHNRVGGLYANRVRGFTATESHFDYNGRLEPYDGSTGYGAILTAGTERYNVKVMGCTFNGNARNGLDTHGGGELLIVGNEFEQNWGRGVRLVGKATLPLRAVVAHNHIHHMDTSRSTHIAAIAIGNNDPEPIADSTEILIIGNIINDIDDVLPGLDLWSWGVCIYADAWDGALVRIADNVMSMGLVCAFVGGGQGPNEYGDLTLDIHGNTFKAREMVVEPIYLDNYGYGQVSVSGNRFQIGTPGARHPYLINAGATFKPDLMRVHDNTIQIENPVVGNPLDVAAMGEGYAAGMVLKDNWYRTGGGNSKLPDSEPG